MANAHTWSRELTVRRPFNVLRAVHRVDVAGVERLRLRRAADETT
jgi:hypothetical protein